MKMEFLIGERFKERPTECKVESHSLLVRGGYIKPVASGIYSLLPLGKRITDKISTIIRSNMDKIGGQEVLLPVVMPSNLWKESGRFDSIGDELIRFNDRNNNTMVLGMTHEEAAVQLVREYANSYTKFPFMIYQIQTKFRDEARPRAGLIRTREFLMKDAYSFHTSKEELEKYYSDCLSVYHNIFSEVGLPDVISVKSDSGMMGGSISHELMLLTSIGEDSIAICKHCDYKANLEVAECFKHEIKASSSADLTSIDLLKIYTSNIKSIEDVSKQLDIPINSICKAVVYQKNESGDYIVVFIRGDLEVNEAKVCNFLNENIHLVTRLNNNDLMVGFIGPYKINESIITLFDKSLRGISNLACGANENNYYYVGLNIERDCGKVDYHDFSKLNTGDRCPICGKESIEIKRGIEVGNIFQLGTKYTEKMNMQYIDKNGVLQYPEMGCYGIGVGRLLAAICEKHHDNYGPVWPITVSPWQVYICCLRSDDFECLTYANNLYEILKTKRIEVILDDRKVRAGIMFSDADLIGVPIKIIISPKNMKNNIIEIITRDRRYEMKVPINEAVLEILNLKDKLFKEIENSI